MSKIINPPLISTIICHPVFSHFSILARPYYYGHWTIIVIFQKFCFILHRLSMAMYKKLFLLLLRFTIPNLWLSTFCVCKKIVQVVEYDTELLIIKRDVFIKNIIRGKPNNLQLGFPRVYIEDPKFFPLLNGIKVKIHFSKITFNMSYIIQRILLLFLFCPYLCQA